MTAFVKGVLGVAKRLQAEVYAAKLPPSEGTIPETDHVIDSTLVSGTRGYLVRVVNQINGAYQHGWYDACAVMLRRLIETLIIEVYVENGRAADIKQPSGHFMLLGGLINVASTDQKLALDRNGDSIRKLKDVGNWSAHKRRYNANRQDIEKYLPEIRIVVQELIYLANYK